MRLVFGLRPMKHQSPWSRAAIAAGAIALATVTLVAPAAQAQRAAEPNLDNRYDSNSSTRSPERVETIEITTIPQAFNDAFFSHDADFMTNRGIGRQFAWLLGFGFPELEINQDTRAVNDLYNEVLFRQNHSDPYMRTADLPNPFNTSLFELQRSGGAYPTPYGAVEAGTYGGGYQP
jgi:hypothetical protein